MKHLQAQTPHLRRSREVVVHVREGFQFGVQRRRRARRVVRVRAASPRALGERRAQSSDRKLNTANLPLERLHESGVRERAGVSGLVARGTPGRRAVTVSAAVSAIPATFGSRQRGFEKRASFLQRHGGVSRASFGEGVENLRGESVATASGVQSREEFEVSRLVLRERAALLRDGEGAAIGEKGLEGRRGKR